MIGLLRPRAKVHDDTTSVPATAAVPVPNAVPAVRVLLPDSLQALRPKLGARRARMRPVRHEGLLVLLLTSGELCHELINVDRPCIVNRDVNPVVQTGCVSFLFVFTPVLVVVVRRQRLFRRLWARGTGRRGGDGQLPDDLPLIRTQRIGTCRGDGLR